MRIHCFQHVAFEGPGSIALWAEAHGYTFTTTRFYDGDTLPAENDVDLLVILGGPMSVHHENLYPWLPGEKAFIRNTIAAGKPVLGVCLGAQLIATALGARVYTNRYKEIGWLPVTKTEAGTQAPVLAGMAGTATVFHWHGDTFDLPERAVNLLQSEGCLNQAFLYGTNVLALQFHLETTADTLAQILAHGRTEINAGGRYVQNEDVIVKTSSTCLAGNTALMDALLNYLAVKR